MEQFFSVTIIYYSLGLYGPVQHTYSRTHLSPDAVRRIAKNFDAIDLNGVDHLVLDADLDLLVQVSGYTKNQGMFSDVIPFTDLKPFLPEGFSPSNHPISDPDSIRLKYRHQN